MKANELFMQHTCSDQMYRHPLNCIYTSGARAVAEELECYWFLDVIASYQMYAKFRAEGFQVWDLRKKENDRATVVCTDGNGNQLTTQRIPYTDFPHDSLTLWFINNEVIMLPSEY